MLGVSINNRRLVQVIDDVFDENTINQLQECIDTDQIKSNDKITAYYRNTIPIIDEIIKTFIPDIKYQGYETWFNKGEKTTHDRHKDDTVTYGQRMPGGQRYNRIVPAIVMIYYMSAKEIDANLHLTDDGIVISPRPNRMVIFGGDTWHQVISQNETNVFENSRLSIAIDVYRKMSEKWNWRCGTIYGDKVDYKLVQNTGA